MQQRLVTDIADGDISINRKTSAITSQPRFNTIDLISCTPQAYNIVY